MTTSPSDLANKNQPESKLCTLQRQLVIAVLTMLACIIIFQVCSYFADILRVLGISILFSYLFVAVVDWLNKYIKIRLVAVAIVYIVVLIGITLSAITLVPTVISQISQLVNSIYEQLPHFVQNMSRIILPIESHLRSTHIEIKTADLVNEMLSFLTKIDSGQIFNRVGDVAVSTMTWTVYGLSILLLSFYFLLDGHKMQKSIVQLFPNEHQDGLYAIAAEIDQSLQAFFKGQVVLALSFGILMTIIYYALGVHYALLLGMILAIFEIIPVIGPTIGFVPTVFSVVFDGIDNMPGNRFTELLIVFAIFCGLQWAKDNLIAPKYMGNVIGLHPVVIFLSIMIGAKIDGWLGIIFALPVACAIQVLAKHIYAHYADSNHLSENIQPDGP